MISEEDIVATVNDFVAFCDFLDGKKPTLSARRVELGKNALFEINSLLKHSREVTAPNYRQESYPVIDLMFNLALNGKLYLRKGNEKGKVYLVASERKTEFGHLNVFEKYAFLLETFWTRHDLEDFLGWGIKSIDQIIKTIAASNPGKRLKKGAFSNRKDFDPLFSDQSAIIKYFSYFGLCKYKPVVETQKPLSRYDDSIEAVMPTELGVTLCQILHEEKFVYWNIPLNESINFYEEFIPGIPSPDAFFGNKDENIEAEKLYGQRNEAGYIPLYRYLMRAFPLGALSNTVTGEVSKAGKSNYIFKVSLGSQVWRTVKLSYKHTLEDLHLSIQQAFDFDDDHLYSFFMDGKSYSKHAYHSPSGSEGPFTDEAVIGDLQLYETQKLCYLFDYGDSWEFDVQLLKIDEVKRPVKKPEIIEARGEAPPQYDYEDDFF